MHDLDKERSPYTKTAAQDILKRGNDEYDRLAAKKAHDDRVKNGIGLDWQQVIHIED